LSPLADRYGQLVAPLSNHLSESALIKYRVQIEILYLISLSKYGVIRKLSNKEISNLKDIINNLSDKDIGVVKKHEERIHHDVKAIELLLQEKLREINLSDLIEKIHYCLTSEDVNNIAYRLMLKDSTKHVILPELKAFINQLDEFAQQNKSVVMMARTHGQDAVPTTLGKEISVFAIRLYKLYEKLNDFSLTGKLGGAIGGWNAHHFSEPQIDWIKFSKNFIESTGLSFNEFTTQINPYEDVVEQLSLIHQLNSIMIDFDQDMWRYISDDWLKQKPDNKSVGSSTMAQKVNPINFENSEGNAQIANGIIEALNRTLPISRLQRDLSNSTIIRNVGPAIGHTLIVLKSASRGFAKIHPDFKEIEENLQSNWSILAEPLQILLRKNNIENSFNLVKDQMMGKKLSKKEWIDMIDDMEIPKAVKSEILKLNPKEYIGYCEEIVDDASKFIKF
jgi:adenylosuccinate lyase